jgi:hypothetical protein
VQVLKLFSLPTLREIDALRHANVIERFRIVRKRIMNARELLFIDEIVFMLRLKMDEKNN